MKNNLLQKVFIFFDKYFYPLVISFILFSGIIYIIFFTNIILKNKEYNKNFIISKTQNVQDISFEEIINYEGNKRVGNFERIWGMKNITLSNNTYRVEYPKGSYKPAGEIIGGGGFVYDIPNLKDKNTVILEYNITIPEDFEFIKGGKLPGLCGGNCPTGGANAYNGFTARMMWRKGGKLEIYGYFSDKINKFGKSLGRGMYILEPGNTYKITQEVQLNKPGYSDGIMKIYINNEIKYYNDHIMYRDNYSIQANRFMFSTFFGGGTPDWATKKDTQIIFSDMKIKY